MEDGKVRKLINEAIKTWSSELKTVEINGSKSSCREVIRWVITVEAFVVAYIRTNPRLGDVKGIRSDNVLEDLNYGVYYG